MPKTHDRSEELLELTRELHRVRHESLLAARNEDYRAIARLTGEAARINHAIRRAETAPVLAIDQLGDKLFTSRPEDEMEPSFEERHPSAVFAS